MIDIDIINMFWDRNENAIKETQKRYGRYCYTIAYNILYSSEDAEECLNDTMMKAWNSIPPAKPKNSLSVYLGRITRNLSINRYKEKHTQKRGGGEMPIIFDELNECIPDENGILNYISNAELTEVLNTFLHGLNKRECAVFMSRYWFSKSIKEISKQFGIKESNVKVILHRTRNHLKQYLEQEGITI